MQVRNIVVAAAGGLIFVALLYLSVAVNAKPNNGASEAELAAARSYHNRHQRPNPSASVRPPPLRRSTPSINRSRARPTPRTETTNERRVRPNPRTAFNRPRTKPLRGLPPGNKGVELRERMREANKAYDRQDYEEAVKSALAILKEHPRNIRMLRVVVSSSCFMGEADRAKEYYKKLPKRDQAHMRIRCSRQKIKLDE